MPIQHRIAAYIPTQSCYYDVPTSCSVQVVEDARLYAQAKHGTMRRRDGFTINHVKQVVDTLADAGIDDDVILSAAWLHDVIEDTSTNYDEINNKFGRVIADMVSSLSKDGRLPRRSREIEYAQRLSTASPRAKVVKLADILVNLKSVTDSPMDVVKMRRKTSRLRMYLLAIRDGMYLDVSTIQNQIDVILESCGLEPVFLNDTLSPKS